MKSIGGEVVDAVVETLGMFSRDRGLYVGGKRHGIQVLSGKNGKYGSALFRFTTPQNLGIEIEVEAAEFLADPFGYMDRMVKAMVERMNDAMRMRHAKSVLTVKGGN